MTNLRNLTPSGYHAQLQCQAHSGAAVSCLFAGVQNMRMRICGYGASRQSREFQSRHAACLLLRWRIVWAHPAHHSSPSQPSHNAQSGVTYSSFNHAADMIYWLLSMTMVGGHESCPILCSVVLIDILWHYSHYFECFSILSDIDFLQLA